MSGPVEAVVRVEVPGEEAGGYGVEVRPGGLDLLGRRCREHVSAAAYAVIADSRVAGLYGERALASLERAGCDAGLVSFPQGEESKSPGEWARLSEELLESGLGRDGAVVGLGGGVTGDLAGFVAATYMRGIPLLQVPTSVLAMVDSSVGGKVAVNAAGGKNLVGAFHHPRHVLADPGLLDSLPVRHRVAGLAEAVKAAAVADAGLLEWMETHAAGLASGEPAAVARVIRRCVEIKAGVVGRDPEERGERAVLNFGHTLGHGLEVASGYGLLHGEAVAAGMRLEARLGEELGLTRPGTARGLDRLLQRLGLGRVRRETVPAGAVMEAAARDKKRRGGELRFVFLGEPGRVARGEGGGYTHAVERQRLRGWLEEALVTLWED